MAVVSSCCEMLGSVQLRAQPLFFVAIIIISLFLKDSFLGTQKKLLMIYKMKERMTSSPHGPYDLGYSCITMILTKSCINENFS